MKIHITVAGSIQGLLTFSQSVLKHVPYAIIFLVLIDACSGLPATTPATTTPTVPVGEDLNDLSAEENAALRSLEKVDDYPLYVMHYSGETQTRFNWPPESGFACSLFAGLSQEGEMIYGRNFDWDFSPALLLFTDPPDGYASVSMVDLTFLGISPDDAMSLTDLPLAERAALLSAPAMPFDGMNEHGLAIAMAAVPESAKSVGGYDPSKPTIGSIGIIREVLDHARSVDEAVNLFEQNNINFQGGPPIHYLVADASGKAALIELDQGQTTVLPNEAPWHLATNHLRSIAKGDGGCQRYHTLFERLAETNGQMDEAAAMQLLSEVAQGGTQWSITYNMTSGNISVVMGQSYETVYPFHLTR